MRIIGGLVGGRIIQAPKGAKTRPTSDRVREAVFSILGPIPKGKTVLDLFGGSGALGLEALSRGASKAVFVEQDHKAHQVLQNNVKELGYEDSVNIYRGDAISSLKMALRAKQVFHWIFIDPPYASDLAARVLTLLGQCNSNEQGLSEQGIIIVEHERRLPPDESYGCLLKTKTKRYGDTSIAFFERTPS